MSLISELRNARSSPKTIVFRLQLDYKPDGKTLHVFFEGQDDESFYMNFLDYSCPKNFRIFRYRCNNKGNVYTTYATLDKTKYDARRLWFFVDRDYTDFL